VERRSKNNLETKARKKDRKRDGREEEARLTLDPDIWPLGQWERTAERGDYPPPPPTHFNHQVKTMPMG
jgi:hypothetical protein